MLPIICLWWVGIQLGMSSWFYILLGISMFIKIFSYGIDMYNKGKENR